MRHWCTAGVLLLLALLAGRAVADDVPSRTEPALAAWERAHAAGDTERAQAIARARHLDPSALAAAMVARQLEATAPKHALGDVVAKLEALRADGGDRPGLGALDQLIKRLAMADAASLAETYAWVEASARTRPLDVRTPSGRLEVERIATSMRDRPRPPASRAVWWVLHQYARARSASGAAKEAREAFEAAAAYARAGEMLIPAARSELGAALVARALEDDAQTIAAARRSLADAARAQEARGVREAVALLANAYFRTGRQAEAARVVAAHMPSATWHRPREQHAYLELAFNVQSQANQPAASLVTARRMHENARRFDSPHALAEALRNLGHASHAVGQDAEAIRHFEAALAHDLTTRPRLARLIHADLSQIWQELGRYDDAEAAAQKALALSRAAKRTDDEAQDLLLLAQALGGAKRWGEALDAARRALGLSVQSGNLRRMGEARRGVAVLYWNAGKAPQAFALLEASRATFAHLEDPVAEVYTLWLAGVYRTITRDFAQGLVLAERCAALLHPTHAYHTRIARLRAAALYGLGRHREAAAAAHDSIVASRRMLLGLAPSDTMARQRALASAASYGLLALQALTTKAEEEARGPLVDEAFWLLESSRATQLNIALRDVRTRSMARLPEALAAAERDTSADVAAAHARLVATATTAGADKDAIRAAKDALEAAWKARDAVVVRIERVSRRAAVAADGRPGLTAIGSPVR